MNKLTGAIPPSTGRDGTFMQEDKSFLGLATIRRNRGISLKQIAESTKISVRSLEFIERGEFQKLPGGIYTTSYIRQYAQAIDYDEAAILAVYHREIAPDGESPKRNSGGFSGLRPLSSLLGS
jgi:cytoskeletal protein RodZ